MCGHVSIIKLNTITEHLTHAKQTVWHSASAFAKAVAPRRTVIFALQKSSKHLSLLVAFRQTMFQIKPLLSAKTLASSIMKPEYEYISSIDYINSLTFDYIETYSLQRGEEFEKEHMLGRTELMKLKDKLLVSSIDAIEQKRFDKLNELYGQTQYLINAKGEFHPSSKKISSYNSLDNKVITLKEILRTEIKDIPMWMCAPIYRDAIVFYKDNKIVSTLNVCLSCEYMETKMFKHVNADNETYKLFRQFFIDCGHDVEEKMPAANTR